jgi:hypothetical protein
MQSKTHLFSFGSAPVTLPLYEGATAGVHLWMPQAKRLWTAPMVMAACMAADIAAALFRHSDNILIWGLIAAIVILGLVPAVWTNRHRFYLVTDEAGFSFVFGVQPPVTYVWSTIRAIRVLKRTCHKPVVIDLAVDPPRQISFNLWGFSEAEQQALLGCLTHRAKLELTQHK